MAVGTSHLEDTEVTSPSPPPSVTPLQLPHSDREGVEALELQAPRGKGGSCSPLYIGIVSTCSYQQTRAAGGCPRGLSSLWFALHCWWLTTGEDRRGGPAIPVGASGGTGHTSLALWL